MTVNKTAMEILRRAGARLVCLGKTKDGHPRHPLYVKGDPAVGGVPMSSFRNDLIRLVSKEPQPNAKTLPA